MSNKKPNLKAILREVRDYANKMEQKSKTAQDKEIFERLGRESRNLIYKIKDNKNEQ